MKKILLPLPCALLLFSFLTLFPADLHANPRIDLVDEQILATQDVLKSATNEKEIEAFTKKLELLKKEREILVRRLELQEQEQSLSGKFTQDAKQQLIEFLNSQEVDAKVYEDRLTQLSLEMKKNVMERSDLERKIDELTSEEETNKNLIDESELLLDILTEEMRALRLEQRDLNYRIRLIQQSQVISDYLENLPINPRPNTRNLIALRRYQRDQQALLRDAEVLITNLTDQREGLRESQKLSLAQLESLNDEISVLEDKLSGINRFLQNDRMLSRAKAQRRLITRKTNAEKEQSERLENSIATLRETVDLFHTTLAFLDDYYQKYVDAYIRRILVPLFTILAISLIYFVLSRLAFPFLFKHDELFNARRLGGYTVAILSFLVISFYFLDDLQAIATVFGIAGAALVIALQDLFSSVAGWFVIVSSRKVKVGDRVEVNGTLGDIIDIQLLRTTLIEVNQWLGVDHPTGRIVVIPNSYIFKDQVLNYSHLHRFLWGNLDILITFESSIELAREVIAGIFEEECAQDFEEARKGASDMELKYGVVDTKYEYKMFVSVEESGVQFKVLFVSHYKRMAATKSRISNRIAKAFEETEGIEFAYPTMRYIPTAEDKGFEVTLKSGPA